MFYFLWWRILERVIHFKRLTSCRFLECEAVSMSRWMWLQKLQSLAFLAWVIWQKSGQKFDVKRGTHCYFPSAVLQVVLYLMDMTGINQNIPESSTDKKLFLVSGCTDILVFLPNDPWCQMTWNLCTVFPLTFACVLIIVLTICLKTLSEITLEMGDEALLFDWSPDVSIQTEARDLLSSLVMYL